MQYILDTNVIREYVSNETLFRRAGFSDLKLLFSPISVIEIASHINKDEIEHFARFKGCLQGLLRSKVSELPDPDSYLKYGILMGGSSPHPGQYIEIMEFICAADRFDQLDCGYTALVNGIPSKVTVKSSYLQEFRSKYEDAFIADVLQYIQHKDNETEDVSKLSKGTRKALKQFLLSDEFKHLMYQTLCARAGVILLGNKMVDRDRNSMDQLDPFISGYKKYIGLAVEGLNARKRKNLYNDLMFLLYLAEEDRCIVTHDRDLTNLLDGTPYEKLVVSVNEIGKTI